MAIKATRHEFTLSIRYLPKSLSVDPDFEFHCKFGLYIYIYIVKNLHRKNLFVKFRLQNDHF